MGNSLRLLPKIDATFGQFSSSQQADTSTAPEHVFVTIGLAGFYNIDL